VSRKRDGFQAVLCRNVDECCRAENLRGLVNRFSQTWRIREIRLFVGFVIMRKDLRGLVYDTHICNCHLTLTYRHGV